MHVNCISVTLMLYEKCGLMMKMPLQVSVPAVNSDLHFRAFSLAVSGLHPLDVMPRGGGLSRVSPQPVHTLPVLLTPVIVWGECLFVIKRGERQAQRYSVLPQNSALFLVGTQGARCLRI